MIKNSYTGKYIMFEGVEGGGKTTQVAMLVNKLQEMNLLVFAVKEPDSKNVFGRLAHAIYTCESLYDELPSKLLECVNSPRYEFVKEATNESGRVHITHFEEIMREVQNGNHGNVPMLLQLSMIFSRLELVMADVIPQLKQGTNVISDRGFLSTLAYGMMDGLDWRQLLEFHDYILGENFIAPDITFVFDIAPEEGLRRTLEKQGGKTERHDKLETLQKVREAYLTLIKAPELIAARLEKIDGSRSASDAHIDILARVTKLLDA